MQSCAGKTKLFLDKREYVEYGRATKQCAKTSADRKFSQIKLRHLKPFGLEKNKIAMSDKTLKQTP